MSKSLLIPLFCIFVIFWLILLPAPVQAFQEHGAQEGLYVHQLGHICFGGAMLWLFFMIKRSSIWREPCWKYIAFGFLLLAAWNAMTFTGHILSLYILVSCPSNIPPRTEWTRLGLKFWIWYVCKLDHVVCVSAMMLFFLGLKKLLRCVRSEEKNAEKISE